MYYVVEKFHVFCNITFVLLCIMQYYYARFQTCLHIKPHLVIIYNTTTHDISYFILRSYTHIETGLIAKNIRLYIS